MTNNSRALVRFIAMLGTASLAVAFAFGACATDCFEFEQFYEDGKKWVFVSSAPPNYGNARMGFTEAGLPNLDGLELTCNKKVATGGSCYGVCSSCPKANEPCQFDDCSGPSGDIHTYACWEGCKE